MHARMRMHVRTDPREVGERGLPEPLGLDHHGHLGQVVQLPNKRNARRGGGTEASREVRIIVGERRN